MIGATAPSSGLLSHHSATNTRHAPGPAVTGRRPAAPRGPPRAGARTTRGRPGQRLRSPRARAAPPPAPARDPPPRPLAPRTSEGGPPRHVQTPTSLDTPLTV